MKASMLSLQFLCWRWLGRDRFALMGIYSWKWEFRVARSFGRCILRPDVNLDCLLHTSPAALVWRTSQRSPTLKLFSSGLHGAPGALHILFTDECPVELNLVYNCVPDFYEYAEPRPDVTPLDTDPHVVSTSEKLKESQGWNTILAQRVGHKAGVPVPYLRREN
ncbi:hypothetical protein BKA82DRAFT_2405409 [Pisolithus tinctorius]|nr:hypothetical protein BKA82DRAFT_2405409 [Pisolithus tinctorius]